MNLGAIHQFHSGTATGDAITNQMFELQRRLRSLGYFSEIYAQHIPPELAERVKPLAEFAEWPSTLLLVHHSMGHTSFEQLMQLSVPMVTVFHSITPARFFDNEDVRRHVHMGFNQLRTLARRSLFGIADSNHNRQQMYDAGFATVEVLPVRTDFQAFHQVRADRTAPSSDWLFVGRIVPNKRQLDLVRAHAIHRRSGGTGSLHLVGDLADGPYVDEIRGEIVRLDASSEIHLHGKVSDTRLGDHYRDAGFFVCLSEHEGFGVPLLEAMAAGLPVAACNDAAIGETMAEAGLILLDRDPATVAAAIRILEADDGLCAGIVEMQVRRLARIEGFDVEALLARVVNRATGSSTGMSLQVLGPFETSYSLAVLNRELALTLHTHDELDVSIFATEGPGDYVPDPKALAEHPIASSLYERSARAPYPEVAIRQMFPPRVADSVAGMTFQYFGWEESRLPDEIVQDFNLHLDGIGTMSNYVKSVLIESGVVVPIHVAGVGVHAPDPNARCEAPELLAMRGTRFLHISSAFPRKGVDVLLRGYFETFDETDDVSLVLKTFPNPHNEVKRMLAKLEAEFPNGPHVCLIDRDFDRSEIDGLFALASAYVHTARGEGFGLPVAEAMLASVPVISVASTGLADFVSTQTAAVIGHTMAPAATHLTVPGSQWTEPSIGDLRRELRSFVDDDDRGPRHDRVLRAHELIASQFSWERVGERWLDFIRDQRSRRSGAKVAVVSTFNSRCGIAEYSTRLYQTLDGWVSAEIMADDNATPVDPVAEHSIARVWTSDRSVSVDRLLESLDVSDADVVHVQHNFGFFTLHNLGGLIEAQAPRRPIVVTLHRTAALEVGDGLESFSDIAPQLRLADAVIVHQEGDRTRLSEAGVVDNVHVIPIGTEAPVSIDMTSSRRHRLPLGAFVIGTFGFLLPHKGLLALVRAVAELRRRDIDARLVAMCALHPDPSSPAHLDEVLAEIRRLGISDFVHLETDYVDLEQIHQWLACADIIAMPYDATNESASAALRTVLPIGRPLVTSRIAIFEDVGGMVPTLHAPVDPNALSDLLEELWFDENRREEIARNIRNYAIATSWDRTAAQIRRLYSDIISAREGSGPHVAAG